MSSPLRAFCRILAYLGLTCLLVPVQAFAVRFNPSLARRLPLVYHRLSVRLLGFHVRTRGQITDRRPVLFVSNHMSYTDIAILGSLLPACFVAKAEVATWPFFGLLARLQRTVFVDRRGPRAAEQRDEMVRRLERGDNLILFPEGTSGDGNSVLPFKSALFSAAQIEANGRPMTIQPISLAYTELDGMPVGRALRPYFAWYGDMALAPHFWQIAGLGHATVDVIFHPPVTLAEYESRKALADHCHRAVSRGVAAANAGRLDRLALPTPS